MTSWTEYLVELHREKDLAYGDAWCRRGEAAGIFPNVARKYDRWIRISDDSETETTVEPLDDTLADLLIYAVKYLLWLLERHDLGNEIPGINVTADTSVRGCLTFVTELPAAENPDQLIVTSFERLEAIFLTGHLDDQTAPDRISCAWSIGRGAWAELRKLPVPTPVFPTAALPGTDQPGTARDLRDQLLAAYTLAPGTILLLGLTSAALELRAQLGALRLAHDVIGIAQPGQVANSDLGVISWHDLGQHTVDYLVVTSDEDKEDLLGAYVRTWPVGDPLPTVILSGTAHLGFHDALYSELDAPALVPSYATGYAYTRVHMFQHLRAAAENGLRGAVVEFGAFKGGTTAWLARVARRLGLEVPILAFDSWDGFPPRRSVLDMYAHPRCVFNDLSAVRAYLDPLGVELVPGDISDTAATRLKDLPILLAFIDTDNYSPASAAITALADNVVPGGAIVFDHYTTTADYVYTLGERIAGHAVLNNRGFLHIHGTGVFLRLPGPERTGSGTTIDRPVESLSPQGAPNGD